MIMENSRLALCSTAEQNILKTGSSFYQDATKITKKANSLMKNWAWKGTALRTISLKYGL
jgi:hypothetical protein